MTREFITIVMPALNEQNYIEKAILSIVPDDHSLDYELIVVDGGSTDSTRDIVAKMAVANPRIKLLHNEARRQSVGVNKAVAAARGDARIVVRADCHAVYPPGFVKACVDDIHEHHAASVVVRMVTVGETCMQKGIAAAQNSILGNGASAHRNPGPSRYVDHGHHAAFDRDFFLSLGGYSANQTHNEDAELDVRIQKAGGRVWLNTSVPVVYFPRRTLKTLAWQYFRHGIGRATTVKRHRLGLKARQAAPIGLLAIWLLGIFMVPVSWTYMIPALAHLILCCLGAGFLALQSRDRCTLLAGPAAVTMHLSWAAGFIYGYLRPA